VEMSWVKGVKWMENTPPLMPSEGRTVVGIVDRGVNSTNHMPGVGGSRNR